MASLDWHAIESKITSRRSGLFWLGSGTGFCPPVPNRQRFV